MEKTDLAYLAGILDGEGCFGFNKVTSGRNRRGHTYVGRFSITNTNLDLLNWVKELLGTGTIHGRDKSHLGHKTCYEWVVSAKQARLVLPQIIPYLKVKKPQAELLNNYLQRQYLSGLKLGLSDNEFSEREDLVNRVRLLNKRGI